MKKERLQKILADHKLWIETGYQEGKRADLSNTVLRDANAVGVYLGNANLSGADLSGADLRGEDLGDAELSGANLRNADLIRACLRHADLAEANLSGANLRNAELSAANLRNADLSGANLRNADLSGADLTGAIFTLEFKNVSWFRGATFSEDAIPWVILNPKYSKLAESLTFVQNQSQCGTIES